MTDELPLQVVQRGEPPRGTPPGSPWPMRVGFVLLLAIPIGLAAFYWQRNPASGSSPDANANNEAAVDPPPSARSVFALGVLEPRGRVISVAAPSGTGESRIESLRVDEGDHVLMGDILAVLDNKERLEAAVKVAHDRAESAKRAIDRVVLETNTSREQFAATVVAAEARLATAETTLERQRGLRAGQATTQEQLDQAETEVTTLQEQLREAQAQLKRFEQPEQGELVDIALARLDWVAASSQLEQAEAELETAFVRAPSDGTILRLNLRVGERIGQTSLLDMGETSQMLALVEVYEAEVPRVRVGGQVTLTASPLEQALQGTVTSIGQLVRRQEIVESNPAATTDARVVEVWVELDEPSSALAARYVNLQVRAEFHP